MLEIVLGICLAVGFIGLLVYLYFHERNEQRYIREIQTTLTNLPIELQKFYSGIADKDSQRTQKLIGESFKDYLKHIEKLERLTLPSPVTQDRVASVLSRVGELAEEENEIEKEKDKGVELANNEWAGLINENTKVSFEEEEPIVG